MRPFKFLGKNIPPTIAHQYGSTNMSVAVFEDGRTISSITQRQQYASAHNNLWYGNSAPHPIWWGCNYEGYLYHRTILTTYEGTIGRFIHTYQYRRRFNEFLLPLHPVIERIQYGTAYYFDNDIKFSHEDMWVRILYTVFYEEV